MASNQKHREKAKKRENALRDNLKKRKAFIKDSNEAALSKNAPKKSMNNAVGGGTEEEALKELQDN